MRLKKYTEYIKESININGLTKTDIELMLEDLTLDHKTFPEELEISISQTKTAKPIETGNELTFNFEFSPRIEIKISATNPPRTFRSYGDDIRKCLLKLSQESRFTDVIDNLRERLDYYDLTLSQPIIPHNLDYILIVMKNKNED
jgi:hypothetical protein